MWWSVVAIGMVGMLVGLRFRAAALIVVAALTIAASFVSGVIGAWSWQSIAVSTGIMLVAVNAGYLAGVVLSAALTSKRRRSADGRSRAVKN